VEGEETELAFALEEVVREEARKKQQATQLNGREQDGTPEVSVLQNSVKPKEPETPIRTDDELGKLAGVSRGTIQKARKIAIQAPEPVKELPLLGPAPHFFMISSGLAPDDT